MTFTAAQGTETQTFAVEVDERLFEKFMKV